MQPAHDKDAGRPGGAPSSHGQRALPGAAISLGLLLAINLFNYVDRQVLAGVEPEIADSLFGAVDPDDPNAAAKTTAIMDRMGWLSTAFLVTYMLTAPVFGWLSERYSRWLLIAVGVSLWSLASGASGLAQSFSLLLVTRCLVGIGEAAYGPVAPTIISDYYPVAVRGRVLAWFYAAIPVGGALGYTLGGQIAELDRGRESWRWAFWMVVIPGILLGLWAYLMREPERGAADRTLSPPRRPTMRDYLILVRTPSYVLNTAGMTAMTFAIGAVSFWMKRYLNENSVPPVLGMAPIGFFGLVTAAAGLAATLAGGMAGDALRGRFPGSYFLVSAAGLLISAPCTLVFLNLSFPFAWIFVFLTVFFLFFNTGPTNTILANVTHPSIRATGFALNILVIHILGDAISPPVVGMVGGRYGLKAGFVVVAVFMFLGGLIWLWGARYLERDTAAAPHRLDAPGPRE